MPTDFNAMTERTYLSEADYQSHYLRSIITPDAFWDEQARTFLSWDAPWDQVCSGDFNTADIRWFINGKLNACYNCVDRHLETRSQQVAVLWEGNEPHEMRSLTYQELHQHVCQFSNVLRQYGIQRGDRVCIYLPMLPETLIAMLACARLGAIHSVVFGGFSSTALKARILDADCCLLITADEGLRGDKTIPFKKNVDEALQDCPNVQHVIVVQRTGHSIPWHTERDIWYHEAMAHASPISAPESMNSTDPLFILYTSGSTGTPKGVLHGTGGYLTYVAMTHRYVFNYHENDVHWCSADVGWITGHSYAVYGPLANGATTLIFEGVPHYPTFSRYWDIVDKHQVNILYTAPTVLRTLRREGDDWLKNTHRNSLKVLGTVGEPINPDVWEWYYQVVGKKRCPVVNTWWQTETGGVLLTPLPGLTPLVAGSVGQPFFGVLPDIIDDNGVTVSPNQSGQLIIKKPWPGLMQTIYGNPQRFFDTYLKPIPGAFTTGDGAYRDVNDQYWITGRNDDVIKVSGHRIGTEEIESALVSHPSVAEAAAVGIPHDIKGECIYTFVTTNRHVEPTDLLKKELIQQVRNKIGPLATPDAIQWTPALPKTRSGKILRRLLRKIANREWDDLGDISTLMDASILDSLIKDRQ